ncbi:MAG: response regulator transcription factor [Terriglobia bacterium]
MTEPKRVVILVEDDPSVLRAIRRLILGAGFEVLAFDRPSAVLASALPATAGCLLVDVHLPEMSGVEMCKTLAASGLDLPVVLITGATDEATRNLMQTVSGAAVLYKPLRREVLISALANALNVDKVQ